MDKSSKEKKSYKKKTTDKPNIHFGHRQRMKEKFLRSGINAFEDHEKLEMLLYYTNKIKDTNQMAHALIKEFGSLSNVLKADIEYLERVEGIGRETAILIKYIFQFSTYLNEGVFNISKGPLVLKEMDDIGKYCCRYFANKPKESLIAILVNAQSELIKTCVISHGTVDTTAMFNREIVECALKHKANGVILAHNHPGNNPHPSKEDVAATMKIDRVLSDMDIVFIDHFVCAGDVYNSMRYRNLF